MKIQLFTLAASVLLFNSCQSEYSERMQNEKFLKAEYTDIEKIYQNTENHKLLYYLNDLNTKIEFEAKISGNEELFLREIWREK